MYFQGISLGLMEEQLNGSHRAIFDGLASEEECKKLAGLGMVRQSIWANA